MKINYELIYLDYRSKNVYIDGNYLIIIGLDGSTTKINLDYLNKKYIIEE